MALRLSRIRLRSLLLRGRLHLIGDRNDVCPAIWNYRNDVARGQLLAQGTLLVSLWTLLGAVGSRGGVLDRG